MPKYSSPSDKQKTNKELIDNKKKNNRVNIRLVSSFMFLCVATATIQNTVQIPLFSEIFSNQSQTKIVLEPEFKIESISSTSNTVSGSIVTENISDYSTANICAYILEQKNANQKYFDTISELQKASARIKVLSKIQPVVFDKYLDKTGSHFLSEKTKYAIILVVDGKIVKTKEIATKACFVSVNVDFAKEETKTIIKVKLNPDPTFVGFDTLLLEVKNLTDPTWGGKGVDYGRTTSSEINPPPYHCEINVNKSATDQSFQVNVYRVTTDPERIALPTTAKITDSEGENPVYYYLIYTYDKPLIIKGE